MKPGHPSALKLVAAALASILMPPVVTSPSAWAQKHLVVADGPKAGFRWDPALTPPLVPVLDALTPGSPHNMVALRKSAQVGATGIGIAWMGSLIVMSPARAMIIFPTTSTVQDYNREKLTPSIEASPELRRRVRMQASRSARGSTSLNKVFPGGSIVLTGANSSADLRSKTVKYQHRDEVDEWPFDLDGQGDPDEMADARLIAFHATGDYMVFKSSTPTIKGRSRIDTAYENGDQRNWHVKCPHCGHEQKLLFGGSDYSFGLKFNKAPPYAAHYVCAGNGCVIEHGSKTEMVRGGRFIAENPKGLYPSFHVDALTSLLTTWDKIAEAFLAAKDNPTKLKAFVNLWLGQSWEERGEAPEWKLLLQRRENFPRGVLPVGALLTTLGVDVQGDGLFYEVVAWGADKQSWSIDAGFIDGDTADPDGDVWRKLTAIWERRYPDAYGGSWTVDAVGVDAGFNTESVKHWVRGRPRAFSLKGMPGWYLPPLGTPAKVDITYRGKKKSGGARIWPVGTWSLKAEFYALLRKEPPHDGAEGFEPGFVHLGQHNDERYCRQLVAETLKEKEWRGRIVKEWVATGDNHFHDCRIYNMALFDHLGGNRWTADQWKQLAQQRGVKVAAQMDFEEMGLASPVAVAKPAAVKPPKSKRRIYSRGL